MGEGAGRLVLAATPLGNAGDASPRLREAFGSAAVVAAEDTRRTLALAHALGVRIGGRLVSYYDHVEADRVPQLLAAMADGADVVLVTDAGMPCLSDPGYRLVAACVDSGYAVTCLPGASAVTMALAVSGVPAPRFCFEGFAPRRGGPRRQWLATLVAQPRAVVFFEAPHRLVDCLADAAAVLGPQRRAAVCRELTKTHEEVVRGTLKELADWAAGGVRGEITVVVAGAPPDSRIAGDFVGEVQALVAEGMRLADACAQVAAASGVSRRELYAAVLAARG